MSELAVVPDALSLLSSLPDPLLVIDDRDRVLLANDAAEVFLGRGRRRLEQKPVAALLGLKGSERELIFEQREGNLTAQAVSLRTFNEGRVEANVLISPVQDHPGWRLVLIEPLHPDRELAHGSRPGEQAAFGAPAVLGHEIKNPLAGIKGAAQLLARRMSGADLKLTDLIISEVDRIAKIIDQMQHLGSRGPANIVSTNIHVVLDRAIQAIRVANPDPPHITINFDPSLPDVQVDPDAAMQVLVNLLQNAIDALRKQDDGAITVTTRFVLGGTVRTAEAGEDTPVRLPVEVTISDNGPGVPAEIRDELFSPFVTSKREGQGLGLAIVRKLMRDMNGRIVHDRDEETGLTHFRMQMAMVGKAGK